MNILQIRLNGKKSSSVTFKNVYTKFKKIKSKILPISMNINQHKAINIFIREGHT